MPDPLRQKLDANRPARGDLLNELHDTLAMLPAV